MSYTIRNTKDMSYKMIIDVDFSKMSYYKDIVVKDFVSIMKKEVERHQRIHEIRKDAEKLKIISKEVDESLERVDEAEKNYEKVMKKVETSKKEKEKGIMKRIRDSL